MEQNHDPVTNSRLRVALFVVVIIALAAMAFAVIKMKRANALEKQLNNAAKEKDSLVNIVVKQEKLLEAEGTQFQNDLLIIDSLENARK